MCREFKILSTPKIVNSCESQARFVFMMCVFVSLCRKSGGSMNFWMI